MDAEVFIGWDSRQRMAWHICARSILAHTDYAPPLRPIGMLALQEQGYYRRPTSRRDGVMFDDISAEPISTEFSLARFFVPQVARAQWALFVDCDFMFRADIGELLALADPRYAVQVVKHDYRPDENVKMDAQRQTVYPRKNWSSCVLWNLRHAGNRARCTLFNANTQHKHWLHGFSWLKDEEIGELPIEWNWLEGASDPAVEPKAVHFTRGLPCLPGYEDSRHAKEWLGYRTMTEAGEAVCKLAA